MAQEQLHVSVHPVVDSMHHQMRDGPAEFRADSLKLMLLCVNDRIVRINPGQEPRHALGQRPLLVLSHEESYRGVGHDDLLHAVEEFLAAYGFGADPHLLLPVAHRIGVRRPVLVSGADEIMREISVPI